MMRLILQRHLQSKKSHNTSSIEPTTITHAPTISQKNQKPTTHNEEKISLVLALAGGFAIWNTFR